jgi:hypothetical protein
MHMRLKPWIVVVLVVLAVLVAARAALPYALESYVDRHLASLESYTGGVEDIDVALLGSSCTAHHVRLDKRNGKVEQPLLAADRVTVGIDWSALLHGEFVGDILVVRPVLNFVDGHDEAGDQFGAGPDWPALIDRLVPFRINNFDVEDGTFSLHRAGEDDGNGRLVSLHSAVLHARDFTNIRESKEPVYATLTLDGVVQEEGKLHLFSEIDPLSDPPVLTLDAEIIDLPLTELNPLLRSYANVDAEAGLVEIFLEFASKEGRFEGYVKPLIRDADVLRLDEKGTFFGKLWEAVVDGVKKILENPDTDRAGAEVPLKGELTAVDAELIPAVFSVLRNAFIEALSLGIGNEIGLEDIGLAPADETPRGESAD